MADIIFPTQITDGTPTGTDRILFDDGISAKDCAISELPISTATQTALNTKQNTSEKGQPNGYASLDGSGKVPASQLPGGMGNGDVVGPNSSTDNAIVRYNGTTGKLIENSSATIDDNGTITLNTIKLSSTPTTTGLVVGELYLNTTENGLPEIRINSTNSLTIGSEMYAQVVNKTGGTLLDGQVVYINGAQGNRPTIALAQANNISTSSVLGVCTANILDNAEGFITIIGEVHGYNTSGFTSGDTLYLSDSVAGGLTNIPPASPGIIVEVAKALNSTNNGIIQVRVGCPVSNNSNLGSDIIPPTQNAVKTYADTKNPFHGVYYPTSVTFNITAGAGTFTVSMTGTEIIYLNGTKYTKVNDSITYNSAVDGTLYYLYYNASGLQISTTPWTINNLTTTPYLLVYYDAGGTVGILYDERHSYNRDLAWHSWAHNTIGARLSGQSSFLITAPNVGSPNTIDFASGVFYDEDIQLSISQQTTARIFYRDPTNTKILFDATPSTTAYRVNGGTGKIQWDNNGTLTDGINNDFYNYFIYANNGIQASNGTTARLYSIMGQGDYANATLAKAAPLPTIPNLPTPELKILYQLVFKQTAGGIIFDSAVDLRFVSTVAGASSGGATNASSVSFTPTGNISSTNVQSAIEEVDTEKVPTSRTITINGTTQDLSTDRTFNVTDANLSTTDITTNNASATKHGFLPKLDNTGTKYLRDDGTWQTISGGSTQIRKMFAIAGTIGATGTNVANTVVVDGSYTISKINMWLGTAGAGVTDLIVDVNLNGTSICSTTKPKITGTNQSSINTGTITTTTCVSGNVFTLDIDQIQSTPGVDLYVELVLI